VVALAKGAGDPYPLTRLFSYAQNINCTASLEGISDRVAVKKEMANPKLRDPLMFCW
jgi:hypothetical protein